MPTTSSPSRSTRASWPRGCVRCCARRPCRTGSATCWAVRQQGRRRRGAAGPVRRRPRWRATPRHRRCSPTFAATPPSPPSSRRRRRWTCLNSLPGRGERRRRSHGGTVADLLGDGVFAFFGAPVIHSDDPVRAVRAALGLQAAVMDLEIPTMPGVRLQTGIGITSGEVIAGNVGSETPDALRRRRRSGQRRGAAAGRRRPRADPRRRGHPDAVATTWCCSRTSAACGSPARATGSERSTCSVPASLSPGSRLCDLSGTARRRTRVSAGWARRRCRRWRGGPGGSPRRSRPGRPPRGPAAAAPTTPRRTPPGGPSRARRS